MKNNIILILVYFYFTAFTNAQSPSFIVKDLNTNQPIQFVAVYTQKGNGTYTNEEGMLIYTFSKNDTLTISHISYNQIKISYNALQQLPSKTIQLVPKVFALKEAVVRPEAVKQTLLGYYKEETFFKRVGPGGQSDFNVYVNHIKNVSGIEGYLNKLYFDLYVDISEKSSSRARIRVFSVGDDGLPKDDLLTKEIIKKVDRLTPNIKIDVSKNNIIFPKEGIFIGLEFFCKFEMKEMKKSNNYKKNTNCPHIPTAKVENNQQIGESYYWTILKGKPQWVCYSNGKEYRGTKGHVYKFGAEVSQ